jgi:hypothetical protein
MRLFEIINFEPKNTNQTHQQRVSRASDKSNSVNQGIGHFARVDKYDSPKRLNQVRKSGVAGQIGCSRPHPVKDPSEDGYLSYIKMVVEDNSQNPYFPRVYNVKTFRSPEGDIYYDVDLEKLVEFNRLKNNTELFNSIKEHLFKDSPSVEENTLDYLLMNAAEGQRFFIKDPVLLDAMNKIDQVAKTHYHNWDLSQSNMMWRMTGTMPQLVLTDPLA